MPYLLYRRTPNASWHTNCKLWRMARSTPHKRSFRARKRSPHVYLAWLLAAGMLIGAASSHAQAVQEPASIARAAENFVRSQIPTNPKSETLVRATELDARLRLAQCPTPLQASWSPGSTPAARTTVAIACRQGATWRVNVPVTIRSRLTVLVLRAPAGRGQALTAADVSTRSVDVDGLAHLYIQTLDELAGRHLARSAPAGVPLPANWFAADKLVKRGQEVMLVASAAGVQIRAPGRALSDGGARERVRVQNLSSLKIVEGVVENGSEVRVTP